MEKLINQTVYKCEICGRVYDEADKAFECEKSHAFELPIGKMTDGSNPLGSYPKFITMKFFDGQILIYKRLDQKGD